MAHTRVLVLNSSGVKVGYTTFRGAKVACGELVDYKAQDVVLSQKWLALLAEFGGKSVVGKSEAADDWRAVRVSDACIQLLSGCDPVGWRGKSSVDPKDPNPHQRVRSLPGGPPAGPRVMQLEHLGSDEKGDDVDVNDSGKTNPSPANAS